MIPAISVTGKRKTCECDCRQVNTIPTRGQPVRDGKKRFWVDLFFEKTGVELERGSKKVCKLVKQDHIEFVMLKEKVDITAKRGLQVLDAMHEERNIQIVLSKYEGFVRIIDSFIYPSRKNPNVMKWITLAERFRGGDFTDLSKCPRNYRDTHLLQIAYRLQDMIRERIVNPDLKLGNFLWDEDRATITDFGGSHIDGTIPSRLCATMGYLSPERVKFEDGGFPGMIFAFGVCIAQISNNGNIPYPSDRLDEKNVLLLDEKNQSGYKRDVIEWRKKLPKNKYRNLILEMTRIVPGKRPSIDIVIKSLIKISESHVSASS